MCLQLGVPEIFSCAFQKTLDYGLLLWEEPLTLPNGSHIGFPL